MVAAHAEATGWDDVDDGGAGVGPQGVGSSVFMIT